jgi:hypothetical protein
MLLTKREKISVCFVNMEIGGDWELFALCDCDGYDYLSPNRCCIDAAVLLGCL